VGNPSGELIRAAAIFDAPTGPEHQLLVDGGPDLRFGRGQANEMRLGHAPFLDTSVPRNAGQLTLTRSSRVVAQNLDDTYAFHVKSPGVPAVPVRPGELFGPCGETFRVHIHGAVTYVIEVQIASRPMIMPLADEEPCTGTPPELTEQERDVLNACVAPILAGGPVPATHAEVAAQLDVPVINVRRRIKAIWAKFLLAGVPMRDLPDRDAIVDAALIHRIHQ
jgi:hypothetical protein